MLTTTFSSVALNPCHLVCMRIPGLHFEHIDPAIGICIDVVQLFRRVTLLDRSVSKQPDFKYLWENIFIFSNFPRFLTHTPLYIPVGVY